MSHSRLVEQVVSGKSAQHIVDALVEELPPLPMLYQIVRKEMPKGTGVRIEESVCFVKPQSPSTKPKVTERADYLQLMYPELEFVVEQINEAGVPDPKVKQIAARHGGKWLAGGVSGDDVVFDFRDYGNAQLFNQEINRLGYHGWLEQAAGNRFLVTVTKK